jgi:hypothetical protein
MLLFERAHQAALHEVVGCGRISGQGASVSSQSRNFAFQEPTKLVHLNLHSGGRRLSLLGAAAPMNENLICPRNPRMNPELRCGKML